MVKRYYIQVYPENFRGNTETRTVAHQTVNREQSNQAREKSHRSDMWTCGEGRWR